MNKIIVAQTAGFCMGVRRAVNLVLEQVEQAQEPIYTIGPLIHNPQVVELLRQRGVIPVESPAKIERGMAVIRSHGVSPAVRKELELKGLKIIDATCPRVARVHRLVEKFGRQGFLIVILGDPGHSEVEGILGFAGENSIVIRNPEEVANLPETDRILLVAQTTQSQKRFALAGDALRQKYCGLASDRVQVINTICDSTERRQDEVSELAQGVDAFVIVGGRQSANTRRLQEIAESCGRKAYLVESEEELLVGALEPMGKVGLTAGASTPNWMIRRVYEELHRISLKNRAFPLRIFYQLLRSIGILNLYLGLGGALLTALVGILLSGKINPFAALATFFYVWSIHNFNLVSRPRLLEVIEPARGKFFLHHRKALVYLSLLGLLSGGIFSFLINPWALLFYAGLSILSLLYQAQFRPASQGMIFRFRSLMDIPGSKDLFSALAWAAMIILVPLSGKPGSHSFRVWLGFVLVFLFVLARSMVQDFRDLQADRIAGAENLPTLLGAKRSRIMIHSLLSLAALILGLSLVRSWFSLPGAGLLAGLIWLWLCVPFFTRRPIIQGLRAELMIDFSFILAGIIGLLMKIF